VAVSISLGSLRNVATVTKPTGVRTIDAGGGYIDEYGPLDPPRWNCAIATATVKLVERMFAATVIAQATHVLSGRFNPGITTKSRVTWVDRAGTTHTANVLDFNDTDGAGVETVALVSEILP